MLVRSAYVLSLPFETSKTLQQNFKPQTAKQNSMSANTTPCHSDQSQALGQIVDRCVNHVDLEGTLENVLQNLLTEISAHIPKGSVTIVPAQAEFSIMSRGMTIYTHAITVRDTSFHVHITY
jgi:hypothetical protein